MNSTKKIAGILIGMIASFYMTAQISETFDSFTLTPNSYYQDNNGTDWQSAANSPMLFRYGWTGGTWTAGTAYTNMKDTTDGSPANLYGCRAYNAFDGANYATVKDSAVIKFNNSSLFFNTVSGFFITNTTHAYTSMKNGSANCRMFGDTTGTGSGDTLNQGEYPDWMKVTVRGYRNGNLLAHSIQHYLADYRPAGTANDYVVKNWRYVNLTSLGYIDSLMFIMQSSDTSAGGAMKTPGYFSIDHITTVNAISVVELSNISNISIFPNPANRQLNIRYTANNSSSLQVKITDISGKELIVTTTPVLIGNDEIHISVDELDSGIYFAELHDGLSSKKIKFIKL